MKVTVNLVQIATGRIASPLADGAMALELADGASAADIIDALALPRHEAYAMLVNSRPLAQEKRAAHTLRDGDTVVIFPPLEGG